MPALAGRDDEAALALADGCHQVDDPRREVAGLGLEPQPLLRVERRELAEVDARLGLVRLQAVDGVQANERVELLATVGTALRLLALARRLDRAGHRVALAQRVALHEAERDVDVVRPWQVAGGTHEGVVVEHVEDAGHRDENVVVGDLQLGLVLLRRPGRAAGALPVAAALSAATAPPAGLVVIGGLSGLRGSRLRALAGGRARRLARRLAGPAARSVALPVLLAVLLPALLALRPLVRALALAVRRPLLGTPLRRRGRRGGVPSAVLGGSAPRAVLARGARGVWRAGVVGTGRLGSRLGSRLASRLRTPLGTRLGRRLGGRSPALRCGLTLRRRCGLRARGAADLPRGDRGDEVVLAHLRRPGDAQAGRQTLELDDVHSRQAGAAGGGHPFGGVSHEGPSPRRRCARVGRHRCRPEIPAVWSD